jgi:hypothetical protein
MAGTVHLKYFLFKLGGKKLSFFYSSSNLHYFLGGEITSAMSV